MRIHIHPVYLSHQVASEDLFGYTRVIRDPFRLHVHDQDADGYGVEDGLEGRAGVLELFRMLFDHLLEFAVGLTLRLLRPLSIADVPADAPVSLHIAVFTEDQVEDRKSTRLNSSHVRISY